MPELPRVDLNFFQTAVESSQLQCSAFNLAAAIHETLCGPSAQADRIRRRFDFFYHEFRTKAGNIVDAVEVISALNDYLFENKGFTVSDDATCGPEELLMGWVLEGRRGGSLPIAVIYREFGQCFGLSGLDFVNFPGHSFVKLLYGHQLLFLDPAREGRLMSVADLQELLFQKYGKDVFLTSSFLETPTDLDVISRHLAKLKNVYFDRQDWAKLLGVLDMIIAISPNRKAEYKERGLLLFQLGLKDEARHDLEHFVKHARPSDETNRIERVLHHLNDPSVTPIF